jgi:hypothetical protein
MCEMKCVTAIIKSRVKDSGQKPPIPLAVYEINTRNKKGEKQTRNDHHSAVTMTPYGVCYVYYSLFHYYSLDEL